MTALRGICFVPALRHVSLDSVRRRLSALPFFGRVRDDAPALEAGQRLRLRGTVGSLPAFVLADLLDGPFGKTRGAGVLVALLAESESADYLRSDLEQVLGSDARVLFFPPTGHDPYDDEQLSDSLPLVQRADALARLREGFRGILVTSVEALADLVPPPETVAIETLTVAVGESVEPERLVERLHAQGFEIVEFVSAPGEMALRGGILDVYPFAGGYPIRLEFFGDEVDSVREFDPTTQRSVSRLDAARLVPNLGEATARDGTAAAVTPLAFLPAGVPLALFDAERLSEAVRERFETAEATFSALPDESRPALPASRHLAPEAFSNILSEHPALLFGTFSGETADAALTLTARPQPGYGGDVRRLRDELDARKDGTVRDDRAVRQPIPARPAVRAARRR